MARRLASVGCSRSGTRFGLALLLLVPLIVADAGLGATHPTAQAQAGSQRVFLPYIGKPFGSQTSSPLNLGVRLDMAQRSSQLVGSGSATLDASRSTAEVIAVTGGVITATASDNSRFTLTIPTGALYTTTQISLIPLLAIDGKPLGGSAGAGVKLEPDGLEFALPVTLTIQTATPITATAELPVAFHGDGEDFYAYPLARHIQTPTFQLLHFSGVAYLGDGISIPVTPSSPVPADLESQLRQEAERLLQNERQAELLGLDPDPTLMPNLIALLRAYYNLVLRPELLANRSNCDWAENGGLAKAFGFDRQVQLYGLDGDFAAAHNEIWNSLEIALRSCWAQKTQPCVNFNDPQLMADLSRLAYQAQMIGLTGFDLAGLPQCTCTTVTAVPAWDGTFQVSWARTAEGLLISGGITRLLSIHIDNQGTMTTRLDTKLEQVAFGMRWQNGFPPTPNAIAGSSTINESSTVQEIDPFPNTRVDTSHSTGGPRQGYATFDVYQTPCTYRLSFQWDQPTTYYIDGNVYRSENPVNFNVHLYDRNAYVNAQSPRISGQATLPVYYAQTPPKEYVSATSNAGSAWLSPLYAGTGAPLGWAQVTWLLVPAP